MSNYKYFYFGRVSKTHGLKGDISIKIDSDDIDILSKSTAFFLEERGSYTPYFVEKSSLVRGNNLIVKFEDIDDILSAEFLLKKSVFLPITLLPKLPDDKFYFHEIIGMKVMDSTHGEIGFITSVNDNSPQPLLEISNGEKEILIPIIDDFIDRVDKQNKVFYTKCPEGLIELYQ